MGVRQLQNFGAAAPSSLNHPLDRIGVVFLASLVEQPGIGQLLGNSAWQYLSERARILPTSCNCC